MTTAELVVDSVVVSYLYRGGFLGDAYSDLVGTRRLGVTHLAVTESRMGVVYANWDARRIARLDAFLERFFVLEANAEISNVCGGVLGLCMQIGRAISWPDAWAAATALWLDVPLVTHDRDLRSVPGLRVLTLHTDWEVRETDRRGFSSGALWMGEGSSRNAPAHASEWARH